MTITYTHQVASSRGFGCFWKLLFRWRGSIYKLVWPDLTIYILLYTTCSIIYRTALNESQKRAFENVAIHCQQFTDLIPVAFVLGFYVSIVVQRWWEQYMSLPWPDALALFVSTCIVGQDERSRVMRRTIMRYVNLTFVITLSMISPRVKKRFPTLDHVMEAGFMTSQEKKIFDDLNRKTSHPKYWMPLVWAGTIVSRARKEGRIRDDFAVKSLIDEISKFRGLSGGLLSYDWISIPLVYTQVVTLAVYTFFLGTIMGRQFLDPARNIPNYTVDFYVPWFTFLQFFFYMGWLKVAETLVNPFGEDDDDFEVNWLIDRNLQVSYLIVDEMHEEHPELIQDRYWDEVFPHSLPYTVASDCYRRMAPQGSTFNMQVPEADQEILLTTLQEEDEDEGKDPAHVKINMNNARTSRESLQSSSSGIAMRVRSPRDSVHVERKGSVLSVLLNRVLSSGAGDGSTTRFSRLGSSLSIRSRRAGTRVPRNSSRLSTVSRASSRDSFSSPRHRGVPSSASVARSAVSADEGGLGASQRWLNREVSMDDEGAILIRVKPDPERNPLLFKSISEVASTKSPVPITTSTSSQTTSVSPTPPSSQRASAALPSAESSTSVSTRASMAKLPPLPIGRQPAAGRPHSAVVQKSSVSSSAGTASHLLSQELGSDDEVQTPWGTSGPPSPACGGVSSSGTGDTGTVRRKGKSGNLQDDPPTSVRSQPCSNEGPLDGLPISTVHSGPLHRGMSVPDNWSSASNEPKMFDFLSGCTKTARDHNEFDSGKDKKDAAVSGNSDSVSDRNNSSKVDKGPGACNLGSQDDQPPLFSYSDSATSVPPSPTSKVPKEECPLQPLLEPDSSKMSLSDRFSTLVKDATAGVPSSEPDGVPIPLPSRKASSIPDGLDVVSEENEAVEEDSENSATCQKIPSAPLPISDLEPASADVGKPDLPESSLVSREVPNPLSFEGRP